MILIWTLSLIISNPPATAQPSVFERLRIRRANCPQIVEAASKIEKSYPIAPRDFEKQHQQIVDEATTGFTLINSILQTPISKRIYQVLLNRIAESEFYAISGSSSSPERFQQRLAKFIESILELDEILSVSLEEDPFDYAAVASDLYQSFITGVSIEGRADWLSFVESHSTTSTSPDLQGVRDWMKRQKSEVLPPEAAQYRDQVLAQPNTPTSLAALYNTYLHEYDERVRLATSILASKKNWDPLSPLTDFTPPPIDLETILSELAKLSRTHPFPSLMERYAFDFGMAPLRSPVARPLLEQVLNTKITDDALATLEKKRNQVQSDLQAVKHPFSFLMQGRTALLIRAIQDFAVTSPVGFRPRKKREKYGDFLFVRPGFQLALWFNSDGSIRKTEFLKLNESILEAIHPSPTTTLIPTAQPTITQETPANHPAIEAVELLTLVFVDFRAELSEIKSEYVDLWVSDLERINRDFPGAHEFLIDAARLISLYPDLSETKDRSWLLSVIRQVARQISQGHRAVDWAVNDLLNRIENLETRRLRLAQAFRGLNRKMEESDDARPSTHLEDYMTEEGLRNLPTDVVLNFQIEGNFQIPAKVIITKDAKEFLQSQDNPLRWFRALKKGTVGGTARNGIQKLEGEGNVYTHELKLVQSGAHLRLGMNQNTESVWILEAPFVKLR